ncbi:MAG: transglutaminase-like domain-containing protein [Candidatus Dojkabacteria bacterium]
MKKIATLSLLFIVCLSPLFTKVVHAASLKRTFSRDYTIVDDYVQVKESKHLQFVEEGLKIPSGSQEEFTIFNPIDVDPDKATKLQRTKDSITLTDSDGRTLDYQAEDTSSGNLTIKFNFPRDITFFNPYSVTLEYKSFGLLIKSGNIRDVYVPAFSKDYIFSDDQFEEDVDTRVIIPKSLGNINFVLPESTQTESDGNYIINLKKEDLVGQTAWIQVGTKQFYSFSLKQAYTKSSPIGFTQNTYKILIPRDANAGVITQKVYFSKITPTPYSVQQDDLGNMFAEFRVPSNESGEIVIEGYAELNQDNSIGFKDSGKLSDIDPQIIKDNTAPAQYWESDSPEIKAAVADLFKGKDINSMSVYEISQAIYTFVTDKIDYSNVKRFGINERQGALATLKGGAAVCMEYSDLYIALMRAAGVPARAAFGFGYSALDSAQAGSDTINHQWAEVYIPSIKSWVGVDTTWGENGNILIGGDLNHFYTHVANKSPNTPSTTEVRLLGGSVDIPERKANVAAITSIPTTGLSTEDELIAKYPKQNEFDINEIPETTSTILKVILALLITFIIVAPFLIRRKNKVKSTIKEIDKVY